MKIIRFLALLGSTGAFLASPPSARSQALAADSAGNLRPDSSLNLAGPRITGVLPPAHLGAGTPSSTTVLRGDGAWVGTTPTGNTIAASISLLMGDGAGNAVAVDSGADLARVLRARLEVARSNLALPANLLAHATLAQGTVNADGTLTVPANGSVAWNLPGTGVLTYLCAVATTAQPAGSLLLEAFYGSGNRTDSTSCPLPGVVRSLSSSLTAGYVFQIKVTNTTGTPIQIFYPSATVSNPGLALLASQADVTPVASQPVADFDFTTFAGSSDPTAHYLAEQQTTLAADSVNGINSNAGTLYAPKLTLQQPVANGSVFGLYGGSVFRESLPLSTLGTTHGVVIQDVALGSQKPLPIVSALDPVANTGFTSNGSGTYTCSWTAESGVANDGYQNVYVVEINTASEAAQPVASRRRMIDAPNLRSVDNTAGTCFITNPGTNQWMAFVHPSDSLAPGSGAYRYEVVSRSAPANWGAPNNLGDGAMSGIELIGGSWGYGSLGSPVNFAGDRLALLHCSTHNAVLGGGSLQHSVFYDLGDPISIQLAWYTADPTGLRWTTDHCLFYANAAGTMRIPIFLVSHSSNGQNYDRGDISDCAFLGSRRSDNSLAGVGIAYNNVATGTINRIYMCGTNAIFSAAMPVSTEVKNSLFREVAVGVMSLNFHDNLLLAEAGGANYVSPQPCSFTQAGASVTNNLFWSHGLDNGLANNSDSNGINVQFVNATCAHNIFVLNPGATAPQGSTYFYRGTTAVTTFNIDYNLIINLSKQGFVAQSAASGYYTSFADYQAGYPTLDQHSMYLDLSTDPRGLQAIFIDPANGDFRWAQTDVASQCAAYCRANNVGPTTVTSHWPLVPTVDEAVRLLTVQ